MFGHVESDHMLRIFARAGECVGVVRGDGACVLHDAVAAHGIARPMAAAGGASRRAVTRVLAVLARPTALRMAVANAIDRKTDSS